MKLFVLFALFVMSWEPSCDPGSSPTGPSQTNEWDTVDPGPQNCASYYGKVVDPSTGRCVQTARICLNGSNCQMSGSHYSEGYSFKHCTSNTNYTIKIKVTAPDYQPDSLVQNVYGSQSIKRHDFKLKRK